MTTSIELSDKDIYGFLKQFQQELIESKQVIELLERNQVETHDFSLATGLSGILMLCSQLQEQDKKWEEVGSRVLQYINNNLELVDLSLWGGLTGIAASTYLVSNNGEYYGNFLKQLNKVILNSTDEFVGQAISNIKLGRVRSFDFETIYGLAGIGRYLLFFSEEEEVSKVIKRIIDYFVSLNDEQKVNGILLPKFFIRAENQFEDDISRYPDGHLDLGISHGICGPLAFLSIALEQGFNQPKQVEAIDYLSSILFDFAQVDDEMVWWPSKISLEEFSTKRVHLNSKYPFAWCYGTPGVARTLWLSGRATNNQLYKDFAEHAYLTLTKVKLDQLRLVSPTYCHGYAGILHQTLLMYLETENINLYNFMETIKAELLTFFNRENPLGFYDVDYKGDKKLCLGGLEGISGIYSTIDSVNKLKKPNWSSLLLLD